MKRLLALSAALAACSSTVVSPSSGDFVGPTGLAVAQAGDRDLLFVTSTATDELRALQICTTPPLADGGVDSSSTCSTKEDYQFVPAPMRLFPATVPTGDRPARIAGTRLLRPDGGKGGVALVAGADSSLAVVDARNIVEAMNHISPARAPILLQLSTPVVDVVAATSIDTATNIDATVPAVKAFLATRGGQLLVLDVHLDSSGNAQAPTVLQRCSLGAVVPARLALVPGRDDLVYVADSAGDGAVRISTASIPTIDQAPQACAITRLPAGGPLRSLALSPQWFEANQPDHPAGELAVMTLQTGGVVIARTSDGQIIPTPPFDYRSSGPQTMEPVLVGGVARDASFLRAIRPGAACATAPCTPLWVGDSVNGKLQRFNLLAAIASTDGGLYFLDVLNRRLVNENYFSNQGALVPVLSIAPILSPVSTVTSNPPALTLAPADATTAGRQNLGWVNPGVTRATRWRAIWHADVPGLERRGGTMTHTATGTLLFSTQPADLTLWATDPLLHLGPGDVVTFTTYYPPASGCDDVASETSARFELPIVSIAADGSALELATLPDTPSVKGFNPTCPKFGVVAEVRTAGDHPWLVLENADTRGRAKTGEMFVALEPRNDYPLDYDPKLPPLASTDIAIAFTLSGTEPTIANTQWTFTMTSGQLPTLVRDANSPQGLASQVIEYSSPKVTNLLFATLTGANALIQAAPDLLPVKGGVLSYH
ncbi:MAG: hypothetical protein E6J78_09980 [Deltaproteobacteria bacterium]|nr:MAG: hypothetical protein E6J78_09980 [Deltaproteobacteria bacterium]